LGEGKKKQKKKTNRTLPFRQTQGEEGNRLTESETMYKNYGKGKKRKKKEKHTWLICKSRGFRAREKKVARCENTTFKKVSKRKKESEKKREKGNGTKARRRLRKQQMCGEQTKQLHKKGGDPIKKKKGKSP